MFEPFGGEHPSLFRFADQSQPDEIGFEHLNGLPGQRHLHRDDVQPDWTFTFAENVQVTLFDGIQTQCINLDSAAHFQDVTHRDEISAFR